MKLYSWGANSYGQLGHGETSSECLLPQCVQNCPPISEKAVVIGGGGHAVLMDGSGLLYASGLNNKGQLGNGTHNDVTTFHPVETCGMSIKEVACGWDHTLALTDDGYVYAWGNNTFMQLGIKDKVFSCVPALVEISNIVKISAGLRHSAAIDAAGDLWTWGNGKKGQLGHVTGNCAPHKVCMAHACQVACGSSHTIVATVDGKLHGWGDNRHGQLAFSPVDTNIAASFGKITDLQSGWTHGLLQQEDGKILTWGRNNFGQLGRTTDENNPPWRPCSVDCDIISCSAGSEHTVGITRDGKVVSWGWNEHGNCGDGTDKNISVPKEISNQTHGEVVSVGCGAGTSFMVVR